VIVHHQPATVARARHTRRLRSAGRLERAYGAALVALGLALLILR
jgi:hypothetical protein